VAAAFEPENELERKLADDPVIQHGLGWGEPRSGHPEGSVEDHVADLLRTLDGWVEPEPRRTELRFLAIVHDALKYRVRGWLPKAGENHHATRARRLAERYTDDERLLAALELHDRPYAIWRRTRRGSARERRALDDLVKRVPDMPLFMRFVELDGSTEGKNPEPIDWLRGELAARGLLE
jgi:hypothetical protein